MKMKRLWPLLMLAGLASNLIWAIPVLMGQAILFLNNPGVRMRMPPATTVEQLGTKIGADRLILRQDPVPLIRIVRQPRNVIRKVGSSLDLTHYLDHASCLADWETFRQCRQSRKYPQLVDHYRALRKLFCPVSSYPFRCQSPKLAKWRITWRTPSIIRLEADIGHENGFATLAAARASLQQINHLLKGIVYGARFPTDFGQGVTENEVFWVDQRLVNDFDFHRAFRQIITALHEQGYLLGLTERDIRRIAALADGGKTVFYQPQKCEGRQEAGGWQLISNNVHITFLSNGCPRIDMQCQMKGERR